MHPRPESILALTLLALSACATALPDEEEPARLVAASTVLPPPAGDFQSGVYLPFNDVLLFDQNGVQVVANGNLALSWVDATFQGTVDEDDQLEDFDAGIGLRGAATVELAVAGGGEIAGSLELATIPLPPFTVGEAIQVSPYLQVKVLAEGSADAGARVSLVAPFRLGTAFAGAGVPEPEGTISSEPEFEPEVGLPDLASLVDFDGKVTLEVTVSFLIAIEGIPIGGPVIGTDLSAVLAIDGGNGIWDLNGLGEIVGGWTFLDPATLLPDIPDDLPVLRTLPEWDIDDGTIPAIERSTRWSRVFDISNDDEAAAALPDGEGLIVFERGGYNWFASLDGLGVAGTQSTSVRSMITKAIVRAHNGDILVTGASGTAIRIDRYTPSGDEIWTRTLSVPGASRTTAETMIPSSSDGAILAGAVTRGGGNRPIVAAIRADGTVEWATEVEMGAGSTSPVIEALAETPTGEILGIGKVSYTDNPSYPACTIYGNNALVLRLDAQGNPLSARAVGGRGHENAHAVAMFGDGSYVIGGDDGSAPHGVWLAALRADDSVRWSASYQSRPDIPGLHSDSTPNGLTALDGSGLLVTGYTGATAGKDAWIMRVDDEGMPRWVKSYISDDLDELDGVFTMPDGLAAFGRTGKTESTSSYEDLWVVRTSVDGMLHFDPATGFDTESTDAQWRRSATTPGVHTLAPVPFATSLDGAPAAAFTAVPAAAVGELLTE
jgi:hypothetical protein